jgi:hypothetical protein
LRGPEGNTTYLIDKHGNSAHNDYFDTFDSWSLPLLIPLTEEA